MSNETKSEKKQGLAKVISYIRISLLINFIVLIPFIVLSFLAIGGNTIFILSIVFVGTLCLLFLCLVVVDIFRMYKSKKNRGTTID